MRGTTGNAGAGYLEANPVLGDVAKAVLQQPGTLTTDGRAGKRTARNEEGEV